MTSRERIDRNKRAIVIVELIALILLLVSAIWLPVHSPWQSPWSSIPFLLGLAMFTLALVYGRFLGLRCPSCGESWYALALSGLNKNLFKLDRRIHYCPYCGCDIDAN